MTASTPTLDQLLAAFILRFREEAYNEDGAKPVGDAEVWFSGMIDLPDVLAPLLSAAWVAGYAAGRDANAVSIDNPYGPTVDLPTPQETDIILSYDTAVEDEEV